MCFKQSGLHIQTQFFKTKDHKEEWNTGLPTCFPKRMAKELSFSFKIYPSNPHLPTSQKEKTKQKNTQRKTKLTHSPVDINDHHHFPTYLPWITPLSSVRELLLDWYDIYTK